jgi:ribosomal protein L37AE/L43A
MTDPIPPCPECLSGLTQTYYAEGLYRCRECGVKYGPYLENQNISSGEPSDA